MGDADKQTIGGSMADSELEGFRGGVIGSIIMLAIAAFVTTCWEVNASRAKEAYSTKATMYRHIVDELGRLEGAAHELQWNVSAWEASRDSLSEILGRDYMRSARQIQDELRRLPFPPELNEQKSSPTVAAQRAWAELEALQVCVQDLLPIHVAQIRAKKVANITESLNGMVQIGYLSQPQADSIASDAVASQPCGTNYSSGSIQELKLHVAKSGWDHIHGTFFSRLFSAF
jgi:hypothetical protein